MTELAYSYFRTGKVFMQEIEWKFLKCNKCLTKLVLDESNEYEEVKICPKCGEKHMLIKKIRKEGVMR